MYAVVVSLEAFVDEAGKPDEADPLDRVAPPDEAVPLAEAAPPDTAAPLAEETAETCDELTPE